jgi:hypothetical protein
MIYEKSLRVSNAVKSEMGVGAIVNLQSNDASKIWNTPLYMHIIWNGPFQVRLSGTAAQGIHLCRYFYARQWLRCYAGPPSLLEIPTLLMQFVNKYTQHRLLWEQ